MTRWPCSTRLPRPGGSTRPIGWARTPFPPRSSRPQRTGPFQPRLSERCRELWGARCRRSRPTTSPASSGRMSSTQRSSPRAFGLGADMNRAQTSAIVLLLASAVAAHEQDARADFDEPDRVADVEAGMRADRPRPGRLLSALVDWALGRASGQRPELVT